MRLFSQNKNLKTMLLLIVFVVTLFESCQNKREQNEALLPTQNPQSQQRDETDDRLNATINSIALGMIKVAQNNSFRNFVHGKAAEQFDGDDNVLLQTLANAETGLNLSDEILTGINMYKNQITSSDTIPYDILTDTTSINTGLDSFPYYDRNLYLQVYIPFIDEVNLNQMPIIAILIDNDTLLQGYKLNDDNTISVVTLTEDMAKSNLVWVISINEVVNSKGIVAAKVEQTTGLDKAIWITAINISDKKEGWGAGRADIAFISRRLYGCGTPSAAYVASPVFCRVSNAKLNTLITSGNFIGNSGLADGQTIPALKSDEFLAVCIYESDFCNKCQQTTTFSNTYSSISSGGSYANCSNPTSNSFSFWSRETPYGNTNSYPIGFNEMNITTASLTMFMTLNTSLTPKWTGGTFQLSGKLF